MCCKGFVRCHRSYIISKSMVSGVIKTSGEYTVILIDGTHIPVGKVYDNILGELFPQKRESAI